MCMHTFFFHEIFTFGVKNINVLILEGLLKDQGSLPLQKILIMSSTYDMHELYSDGEDNNISPTLQDPTHWGPGSADPRIRFGSESKSSLIHPGNGNRSLVVGIGSHVEYNQISI